MEGPCDTCKFYSKRIVQQEGRSFTQEVCRCVNEDCPEHGCTMVWKLHCIHWHKK